MITWSLLDGTEPQPVLTDEILGRPDGGVDLVDGEVGGQVGGVAVEHHQDKQPPGSYNNTTGERPETKYHLENQIGVSPKMLTDMSFSFMSWDKYNDWLKSYHLGIPSVPCPSSEATLNQTENRRPWSCSFRRRVIIAREIVTKNI